MWCQEVRTYPATLTPQKKQTHSGDSHTHRYAQKSPSWGNPSNRIIPFFFFIFKNNCVHFFYFRLLRAFTELRGFVSAAGAAFQLRLGVSLRGLLLLRSSGFGGCSTWAQRLWLLGSTHRLNSCGVWDLPGPGITPASLASAGRFFTAESPEKPRSVGTPRGWGNIVPSPSASTRTSFQGTARKVGRVALLGTPGATRQAGGQGLPPQPEAMLPANTSDAAWEGRPAPVLLPPNLPLQS